jgi:hypothetical protein
MASNFALAFQIYGLAIFVSLIVAVAIRGIVSTLSALKAPRAKQAADETAQPSDAFPQGDIAAIAAAVYAMLGAHRILHIEDRGRGFTWTAEGRAAHHASHAVPHHPKR